jgi:hypothetical protein
MLSLDELGFAELRAQAATALVEGRCGCGCATVDLVVDRDRTPRDPLSRSSVVVSSWHKEPIDNALEILVFLDGGWLSRLEVSWLETPPAMFPPITEFEAPVLERPN